MKEIPLKIRREISKYNPITTESLTLYPIRVFEHDDFIIAKESIEFLPQALPVRLISKPLLSAFYALDIELISQGEKATGLFFKALLMLALALRIGEGEDIKDRVGRFKISVSSDDPFTLKGISFLGNNDKEIKLSPVVFQKIRPIIALQNGIEIYSDKVNPELIQAEKDILSSKAIGLKADFETLIHSVAAFSGRDESEIYDWPILKLNHRASSYKRAMDYMLHGIMEAQGCKWKGGNPTPNPWYEKEENTSESLIALSNFAGGEGEKAIKQAGF